MEGNLAASCAAERHDMLTHQGADLVRAKAHAVVDSIPSGVGKIQAGLNKAQPAVIP